MLRLQLIFLQLIFFSQGNANSVQKEPCINLMNFLDERTTFIFQKTAVKVIKRSLWRAWKRRQLVLNSALSALWANVVFQVGSGSCCQSWTPEGWRMHIPLRDRHCRAPCAAPGQHNPTSWIAKLVSRAVPQQLWDFPVVTRRPGLPWQVHLWDPTGRSHIPAPRPRDRKLDSLPTKSCLFTLDNFNNSFLLIIKPLNQHVSPSLGHPTEHGVCILEGNCDDTDQH